MESLHLAIILLACVIASSLLAQIMHRFSLPLVQIAIGLVVALLLPEVQSLQFEPELFMVLFVAPLLFNESRSVDPKKLWKNKCPILSLAIGLVIATTLGAGFLLNLMAPSIPLAAAFACAAALSPTDAAAVGSLSSSVKLTKRQRMLMSGESLINDASGIVAFQFAVAAVVTGSFSIVDAGADFCILFFGGIALGAALGLFGKITVHLLRNAGLESTTLFVTYEVFSPFFVYLVAQWLNTSGILAVVAAGIAMAERRDSLVSATSARHEVVSDAFWSIIVFIINSVIFISLGMQLPRAFAPAIADTYSFGTIICLVGLLVFAIEACRFIWVFAMEAIHLKTSGRRDLKGKKRISHLIRESAIYTAGGPKGAVTLSIAFTLPYYLANGSSPFPDRGLLIFLVASVVLCTLLIADICLPILSPRKKGQGDPRGLKEASILVLEGTVRELESMLEDKRDRRYEPALKLAIAQYRLRLYNEKAFLDQATGGNTMREIDRDIKEIQGLNLDGNPKVNPEETSDRKVYYNFLKKMRRIIRSDNANRGIVSRIKSVKGWIALQWQRATSPDASKFVGEVDADALTIELEQIRHLHEQGKITLEEAKELRGRVYNLQMGL